MLPTPWRGAGLLPEHYRFAAGNTWPWTRDQPRLSPEWWDREGSLHAFPLPVLSSLAVSGKQIPLPDIYSPNLKGMTYHFTTNHWNKNNCELNHYLSVSEGTAKPPAPRRWRKPPFMVSGNLPFPLALEPLELCDRQKLFWPSKAPNLPLPITNNPSSVERSALATLSASSVAKCSAREIAQDHQSWFITVVLP